MILLSAEKVAEIFGVKPRTILEKYTKRRDFPQPVRLSARVLRWDAAEIESFIQACRK